MTPFERYLQFEIHLGTRNWRKAPEVNNFIRKIILSHPIHVQHYRGAADATSHECDVTSVERGPAYQCCCEHPAMATQERSPRRAAPEKCAARGDTVPGRPAAGRSDSGLSASATECGGDSPIPPQQPTPPCINAGLSKAGTEHSVQCAFIPEEHLVNKESSGPVLDPFASDYCSKLIVGAPLPAAPAPGGPLEPVSTSHLEPLACHGKSSSQAPSGDTPDLWAPTQTEAGCPGDSSPSASRGARLPFLACGTGGHDAHEEAMRRAAYIVSRFVQVQPTLPSVAHSPDSAVSLISDIAKRELPQTSSHDIPHVFPLHQVNVAQTPSLADPCCSAVPGRSCAQQGQTPDAHDQGALGKQGKDYLAMILRSLEFEALVLRRQLETRGLAQEPQDLQRTLRTRRREGAARRAIQVDRSKRILRK